MSDLAVLLTPGAGSSRDHTSLVAIEVALAPHVVERLDFPYRIAGRRAPDRPTGERDGLRVPRGECATGSRFM